MRIGLIILTAFVFAHPSSADEALSFNRDVRPILAEHCWQCHGPDEAARKAGLRLDVRSQVLTAVGSGAVAVVPHDPGRSELFTRITASEVDLRMPPAAFNKPLSGRQIETLRNWIAQGAEYQRHWAFEPPSRAVVPEIKGVSNPVDAFVAAKLTAQGINFSPEASRETLLRRLSFDLTGLPPSMDDLDRTEESYEQSVDRLLSSPHFGERMAVDWLDAARYADTNGYFSDKPRQMWLWRDWVINAFNSNVPYDQFTIEQIAGDLLPDATIPQRIATGFNRNHVANNETGIIDEEFRTEYVVDRVDTTMTTWMGLTAGCAQCHDHKYDPISQHEFYQLFAFFNNVPETGLIVTNDPPPLMTVTTPDQDQQLAALTAASTEAMRTFETMRTQLNADIAVWEADALRTLPGAPTETLVLHEAFSDPLNQGTQRVGTTLAFQTGIRGMAAKFDATQHAVTTLPDFDPDSPWSIGFWVMPDGSLSSPLSKIEPEGNRQGFEFIWQKGRLSVNLVERWGVSAIEISTQTAVAGSQWHHFVACCDGSRTSPGVRIFVDGVPASVTVHRDSLTGSIANAQPLLIGRRDSGLGYYGLLDELRILQRSLNDQEVADWFRAERIRGIVETPPASRNGTDSETLLDDYAEHLAGMKVREARKNVHRTQQSEKAFRDSIPTALVMEEMQQPRTTHVLTRGQYDQPADAVQPGVPSELAAWPGDAPRNRLGFAKWLVSNDNPLTARVAVNRLWKQCFGDGLVRTMNDFGTQGEPPSHPELLDWLAVTFRESGWDLKAMLRLIVTSRTYRQNSGFRTDRSILVDPQNRLLSRSPRFRMSAEMIRDQALTVSGLLRPRIGGPSVKPYQPEGLWEEVSYNAEDSYIPDIGDGLWRRSLYTYLKRQAPPPSFLIFDGTTREKCTVQRARTNTPLQSLILLNDPTYVEAARALAVDALQPVSDDPVRLQKLFRQVLSRPSDETESQLLRGLLNRQRERFLIDPAAATALLHTGGNELPADVTAQELAAWTVVAHTVLNLDEAITRR